LRYGSVHEDRQKCDSSRNPSAKRHGKPRRTRGRDRGRATDTGMWPLTCLQLHPYDTPCGILHQPLRCQLLREATFSEPSKSVRTRKPPHLIPITLLLPNYCYSTHCLPLYFLERAMIAGVSQTHGRRETGLCIESKCHCQVMAGPILSVVASAFLIVSPVPAFAEWFGDVYGGIALPESTTAQFDQRLPSSIKAETKLDLDASPTGGVRGGYWFGHASGYLNWFGSSIVGVAGGCVLFPTQGAGSPTGCRTTFSPTHAQATAPEERRIPQRPVPAVRGNRPQFLCRTGQARFACTGYQCRASR